ncbi:hypothetical protein D9M68_505890 [compost metagenome]
MVEQQPQVGATLQQLARHLALGTGGQLHLQQRKSLAQGLQAGQHRLIRHGFILGQAQARLFAFRQPQGLAIQALALPQDFPGLLQQGHARRRQARLTAAAAVEQLHP